MNDIDEFIAQVQFGKLYKITPPFNCQIIWAVPVKISKIDDVKITLTTVSTYIIPSRPTMLHTCELNFMAFSEYFKKSWKLHGHK